MSRAAAMLVVSLVTVFVLADTGRPLTDLNLRTAPTSRRSNVITVLGPSDEFEILETRRGWYRVKLTKTRVEGWVAQKYVRLMPPQPQEAATGVADSNGGRSLATGGNMGVIAGLLALIGYITGFKPRDVNGAPPQQRARTNPFTVLLLGLTVGSVYLVLTLPKILVIVGTGRGWAMTTALGRWGLEFNERLAARVPAFPALLQCIFWMVLFYLVSLLVLALRHDSLPLFRVGALTLVCSIPMFYLLSWGGYVAVMVLVAIRWTIGAIAGVVGWIFGGIFSFLSKIIVAVAMWIHGLLYQLLGEQWWLVLACVAAIALAVLLRRQTDWVAAKALGLLLLGTTAAGFVVYVLYWLWTLIAPWVMPVLRFIAGIAVVIATLLLKLIAGLGVLLALAAIGQLLVDQIRGALSAGRRGRGVVIGALAIGSSIAILLLVSNVHDVNVGLPAFVMMFASEYLHQPSPMLDALIAFGITALSVVGIWRNMPALGEEPTTDEFRTGLVLAVVGVVAQGGIAALGNVEE
jgi:hypothetical protein